MRVLVACEFTGAVRDAFSAVGCDSWSCDLIESESPGNHIVGDIRNVLMDGWDLMIAHPPCTHLAVSGARWFSSKREQQRDSVSFFMHLMNAPISKICIENPVGIMSSLFRAPDQIVQPWQFGDSYQKTTCLWLKGLPLLLPTLVVDRGEFIDLPNGGRMPKWYADAYKKDHGKIRSRTFPGMATAMATQWGIQNRRIVRRSMGVCVPYTLVNERGRSKADDRRRS